MLKKVWIGLAFFSIIFLSLSIVHNGAIENAPDISKKLPLLIIPNSIAIDGLGTIYICSDDMKQVMAFDSITGEFLYSFKVDFDSYVSIVGAGKDTAFVHPIREIDVSEYKDGKLVAKRKLTEKEDSINDKKDAVDQYGNKYILKNTFGRYYIKVIDSNQNTRKIFLCSMGKSVFTICFRLAKFVCGAISFVLFIFICFQGGLEERFGEERIYSLKDMFNKK